MWLEVTAIILRTFDPPIHTNIELLKYTKLVFYPLLYMIAFYYNRRSVK